MPQSSPTVRVLFVGGYGRSGSTMLDRLLGRADGVCSTGEVRHLWQEGFEEDRRCGCGERFSRCPFWTDVVDRAFGGRAALDVDEVLALKRRVDQWWWAPRIARGGGPPAWRADLGRYLGLLRRLYPAVAEVSGCDVLVDSSKDVSHGYLLAAAGAPVEVSVVHLVRDPRAVAYSWYHRTKFDPGMDRAMDRYGLLKISAEWNAVNALVAGLRWVAPRYQVLRYESLVGDPAAALRTVLARAGLADRAGPFDAGREVELGVDHLVAGNPVRFARGTLTVRPDEEWRDRFPPRQRALVRALTAPAAVAVTTAGRGRGRGSRSAPLSPPGGRR